MGSDITSLLHLRSRNSPSIRLGDGIAVNNNHVLARRFVRGFDFLWNERSGCHNGGALEIREQVICSHASVTASPDVSVRALRGTKTHLGSALPPLWYKSVPSVVLTRTRQ